MNFYEFLLKLLHSVFEPQLVKWILSINGELLTHALHDESPTLYMFIFDFELNVLLQQLQLIILFASGTQVGKPMKNPLKTMRKTSGLFWSSRCPVHFGLSCFEYLAQASDF